LLRNLEKSIRTRINRIDRAPEIEVQSQAIDHRRTGLLRIMTRYLRQKFEAPMASERIAYVSFHLMPIYMQAARSPSLKKRIQGKTCFNFKAEPEPELIAELTRLTETGFARWQENRWVRINPDSSRPASWPRAFARKHGRTQARHYESAKICEIRGAYALLPPRGKEKKQKRRGCHGFSRIPTIGLVPVFLTGLGERQSLRAARLQTQKFAAR
jgi:hypothetical protein